MNSDFLSLVLPDDCVRKITRSCPFCTRKYKQMSGFFGLCVIAGAVGPALFLASMVPAAPLPLTAAYVMLTCDLILSHPKSVMLY